MGTTSSRKIFDPDQNPLTEKEAVFVDVGLLFKETRQEKGLTIQDVADAIHIRRLYLTALEEGCFSELPGQVYTIGFIRSYAKFLDLDGTELLRRLDLLTPTIAKPVLQPPSIPVNQQGKPSFFLVLASSLLFLSFLVSWFFYNTSEKKDSIEPEITAIIPEEENQALQTSENLASVELPSIPQLENEEAPPVSSALTEPETSLSKAKDHPLITLQAIEDTWVQILNTKGDTLFMRVMKAGDSYRVPNEEVKLNTGNAGGLRISLGDEQLPVMGEKGKVVKGVSLTPESVRQFYQITE